MYVYVYVCVCMWLNAICTRHARPASRYSFMFRFAQFNSAQPTAQPRPQLNSQQKLLHQLNSQLNSHHSSTHRSTETTAQLSAQLSVQTQLNSIHPSIHPSIHSSIHSPIQTKTRSQQVNTRSRPDHVCMQVCVCGSRPDIDGRTKNCLARQFLQHFKKTASRGSFCNTRFFNPRDVFFSSRSFFSSRWNVGRNCCGA